MRRRNTVEISEDLEKKEKKEIDIWSMQNHFDNSRQRPQARERENITEEDKKCLLALHEKKRKTGELL